jgi:hypothetical protein
MDTLTRKILKDFELSGKAVRLPWVLEVKLGANTFRVEIPETPKKNGHWHADAYQKTNSRWKLITDLDADERHKDDAIRWVLSRLVVRSPIARTDAARPVHKRAGEF